MQKQGTKEDFKHLHVSWVCWSHETCVPTSLLIKSESSGKEDYILGLGGDHSIPSITHSGVGVEVFSEATLIHRCVFGTGLSSFPVPGSSLCKDKRRGEGCPSSVGSAGKGKGCFPRLWR